MTRLLTYLTIAIGLYVGYRLTLRAYDRFEYQESFKQQCRTECAGMGFGNVVDLDTYDCYCTDR